MLNVSGCHAIPSSFVTEVCSSVVGMQINACVAEVSQSKQPSLQQLHVVLLLLQ